MRADLLLTHGYFLDEDEKEQEIMRPYPPLGLLYLSSYLKGQGLGVEVFDSTLRRRDELDAVLATERGGVVGVYTTMMTRGSVVRVLAAAREHGWTTVVGGPDACTHPARYLEHGADVVVLGEGETTLTELVPILKRAGAHRLHGVLGTAFRASGGDLVTNPPRPRLQDLDALPWPDRTAIDLDSYLRVWREHHGRGSINLITARGCAFRCRWCSHSVFGHSHRRRSPAACADEVQSIADTWAPEQLWYADDVFTIHHGWLLEYAAELERRGVRIPFETISRADRMMNDEVVATLARMGCELVWIGAESGSQRILDAMGRGVTVDQIEWACKAARRHGIEVGLFVMWGYDGEGLDDIEATVELVARARPDVFFTTVAYPIAGTPYHAAVSERVVSPLPWASSSDRDNEVRGRPERALFRLADRWIRNTWQAERATEPAAAAGHRAEATAARDALVDAWRDPELVP